MNLEELLQTHNSCSIFAHDSGRLLYYDKGVWCVAKYLPVFKDRLLYQGPDLETAIEALLL